MIKIDPYELKRSAKRSKLQLFIDILKTIENGEYKPTRIMYKSNLSWQPLKQILNRMVELELVEKKKIGTRQSFRITERGKIFLKTINELRRFLAPSPRFSVNIDSIISSKNEKK